MSENGAAPSTTVEVPNVGENLQQQFLLSNDTNPAIHDPHHGHHHLKPSQASFVLWTTVIVFIVGQAALVACKKHYPRGYSISSLIGLWLMPLGFSIMSSWYRFLCCWILFSLLALYFLYIIRYQPLSLKTPRYVYLWLDITYRSCLSVASFTGSIILVLIFVPLLTTFIPTFVLELLVSGLTYSIYFGVLIRDIGEVIAEIMVTNVSKLKLYQKNSKDDDDDNDKDSSSFINKRHNGENCALCGEYLRIIGEGTIVEEIQETGITEVSQPILLRAANGSLIMIQPGTPIAAQVEAALRQQQQSSSSSTVLSSTPGRTVPRPSPNRHGNNSSNDNDDEQKIHKFTGHDGRILFQLQCKHVFHEDCIKGWCVIGKKDTCPSCAERVDLRILLKTSAVWGPPSLLWSRLLDMVRYLVVWNPLAFLILQLVFWEAGVPMS